MKYLIEVKLLINCGLIANFAPVERVMKRLEEAIFEIKNDGDFEEIALEVYELQRRHNPVFSEYLDLIGHNKKAGSMDELVYLPIELFKSRDVIMNGLSAETTFKSSGTSQSSNRSRHLVASTDLYRRIFNNAFEKAIAPVETCQFFSLLPNYEENKESSLLFMVDDLISRSARPGSRSFQVGPEILESMKEEVKAGIQKVLFGVSFALLDLAEGFDTELSDVIIIETGGMKGRRKELTRAELHGILHDKFKPKAILAEYGMTELMSQAYTKGDEGFYSPAWMKALIRDIHDPLSHPKSGTGGLDIIDLGNLYSCSFISTSDIGRIHENGSFEVLGRMDYSDIRGCNLLYQR